MVEMHAFAARIFTPLVNY